MKPSTSILGASRLPLTPKRGNKDFYKGKSIHLWHLGADADGKGTRQSYVPGGGHRTGPPGRHVVQGKAKYRLLDTRVRYFVGPGAEAMASTEVRPLVLPAFQGDADEKLRPYVSTQNPSLPSTSLPSFSPNPDRPSGGFTIPAYTKFSRQYQRLSAPEKEALKVEARRKWWDGMVSQFGDRSALVADEEAATREVEKRAQEEKDARP